MVHPRWWLEGHTPPTTEWSPTIGPQAQAQAQIQLPNFGQDNDLQALFYDTLLIRDQLPSDAGRRYTRQLQELLQKHILLGHRQLEFERLPLVNIDDNPRATKRPIPTATDRQKAEAREFAKAAFRKIRDDAILTQRQAEEDEQGPP